MLANIEQQAYTAMAQLCEAASLREGQIVVVGCSTSEVMGKKIGTSGTLDVANALIAGFEKALEGKNVFLAVQCCEHLNRALVVPSACQEKYGFEEVSVVPHAHAGGSLGTAYFAKGGKCMVEAITAHAGMDIGGTLIGMHLKRVAVPVRLTIDQIGEAHVLFAKTRPKLIGGERAHYA